MRRFDRSTVDSHDYGGTMRRNDWLVGVLCASVVGVLGAQDKETRPGYLDPEPILRSAETAIGTDKLSCVTISGSGYAGIVGQQRLNGYEVDWPRGEPLTNYTRVMNWDDGTMLETFDREPGHNPAAWKYGLGWRGGEPIQRHSHQTFAVNGTHGWSIDGPGNDPVAAPPADAELWQLDMWINPHGFLKAARLPGANPQATWAMGAWRDGSRRRDRESRKGSRRLDHGDGQVSSRRNDQLGKLAAAHPHVGSGPGDRRL